MMFVNAEGIWILIRMKDCELNWSMGIVCRTEFIEEWNRNPIGEEVWW